MPHAHSFFFVFSLSLSLSLSSRLVSSSSSIFFLLLLLSCLDIRSEEKEEKPIRRQFDQSRLSPVDNCQKVEYPVEQFHREQHRWQRRSTNRITKWTSLAVFKNEISNRICLSRVLFSSQSVSAMTQCRSCVSLFSGWRIFDHYIDGSLLSDFNQQWTWVATSSRLSSRPFLHFFWLDNDIWRSGIVFHPIIWSKIFPPSLPPFFPDTHTYIYIDLIDKRTRGKCTNIKMMISSGIASKTSKKKKI